MLTGWALFFSLVVLVSVEKGKQRYNKTTKGNQQSQYTYENRNDFKCCHLRHLPSYVLRQTGHEVLGGYHLATRLFLSDILSYSFFCDNSPIKFYQVFFGGVIGKRRIGVVSTFFCRTFSKRLSPAAILKYFKICKKAVL